jgi:hypothetical protein
MQSNLRALRLALVDEDRALRNARDDHENMTALRTKAGLDSGAVVGKNAEERKVTLGCFLAADAAYQGSLAILRGCEWQRDRMEALLEAAKDERRKEEWQIRCRLADAIISRNVQSDTSDPAGDSAYNDAMQSELDDALVFAAQNGVDLDDDLPW